MPELAKAAKTAKDCLAFHFSPSSEQGPGSNLIKPLTKQLIGIGAVVIIAIAVRRPGIAIIMRDYCGFAKAPWFFIALIAIAITGG